MDRSTSILAACVVATCGSTLLLQQWIGTAGPDRPGLLVTGAEPEVQAAAPEGAATARPEGWGPLNPELVVETPAELRAFVRACEGAALEERAQLRELVRRSDDALVVRHAVRALGRLGGSLEPMVIELLANSRRPVRHAAIRALAGSRDEAALVHLAPLLRDGDETARCLAIQGVGRIGGEQATALLASLAPELGNEVERAFVRAAQADAHHASATRRSRP